MNEHNNTVEYKYSSEWTKKLEDENHWRLYWQQQRLMEGFLQKGEKVIEIGVGSGFAANYLKAKGINVTTIDIDEDKHPDIVANIVEYNWDNLECDHILAFEVFEHIPFEKFEELLPKLKGTAANNIFMSVPLNERVWFHAEVKLPLMKRKTIHIATNKNKIETEHHFWEVNYDKYTMNYISNVFNGAGLEIQDTHKKLSRLFLRIGHIS